MRKRTEYRLTFEGDRDEVVHYKRKIDALEAFRDFEGPLILERVVYVYDKAEGAILDEELILEKL